jgi:hypothetical protein
VLRRMRVAPEKGDGLWLHQSRLPYKRSPFVSPSHRIAPNENVFSNAR